MKRRGKLKPPPNLALLLDSWELALNAERKSPQTVKSYGDGVRRFLAWCGTHGFQPVLDRPTVARFVADLLGGGAEPATARSRHLALRRYAAWLVEEGELATNDLLGSKPPKLDTKVVPVLTTEQITALIKVCQGPDLRDRRDEALVRLMVETGCRAGEAVGITTADVDLRAGKVTIRRGKGGKGRTIYVSRQTGRAIDRYLRLRRSHRLADTPALWLGDRGKPFVYDGLHAALRARAAAAGIEHLHPHVLRHTAASRWLAAGGSEGGLMATAGWTRRDMIDRYTRATASDRAGEEARRLNLGDL